MWKDVLRNQEGEEVSILGLLTFFFLNIKLSLAGRFGVGELQFQVSLSSVYALRAGQGFGIHNTAFFSFFFFFKQRKMTTVREGSQYLRSSLKGEAYVIISSLLPIPPCLPFMSPHFLTLPLAPYLFLDELCQGETSPPIPVPDSLSRCSAFYLLNLKGFVVGCHLPSLRPHCQKPPTDRSCS